jgi:hypothetical protein
LTRDSSEPSGYVVLKGSRATITLMPEETEIPEQPAPEQQVQQDDGISISWTGPEFIAHSKDSKWYMKLAGSTLLVTALVLLLTRDKISAGVVIFGALLFGVYAARQPRQLDYHMSETGLSIGEKYYDFQNFRSFALAPESEDACIILIPLRRFGQSLSVFFQAKDEERIINVLTDRLPFDQDHNDPIDNLMRRIHF